MTNTNLAISPELSEEGQKLYRQLVKDLTDRHGPMLSDENLQIALGYRSMDAFRQALARRAVEVTVFSLPKVRGKFALVTDVAFWLVQQRETALRRKEVMNGLVERGV